MKTHTLRRAFAALAVCAIALTGIALTPVNAHAASTPILKLTGSVVQSRGGQLHLSVAGFPANSEVQVSLTYAHAGGGSGGQSGARRQVSATGTLSAVAGIPDALPAEFNPSSNTDDYEVVATTTDGAVSAHAPWRLLPAPATITVDPASALVDQTVHVHSTGYYPGQQVDLETGESTQDIGLNHRVGLFNADSDGVLDTDVTVPQIDLAEEALGYNDSPASTIFAMSSVNGLGIMPSAPFRIAPPTTDLSGVPDLCQDDNGGSWRTDGGHGAGPSVCVYTRDGTQGSAKPGDTVQAVGFRWFPGSTVTLYVVQNCAFTDEQGARCTIDGDDAWHPGTDAVRLGSVQVGLDGVIGPQPLKVPSFPTAWVGTPTSIVAVGPHTPVYPQAGDAMGTTASDYAWTLTPADPPPPVVTPTPTPTPTPPVVTPTPTPTSPTPDPTSPTPTPRHPVPHRSSTPPPVHHSAPPRTTPARPTPNKAVGPPLASTGVPTDVLAELGALLIALGVGGLLLGRKRRRGVHRS